MTRSATRQHPVTVRVFTRRFSATPLGARLARHLALNQLHDWGIPHGTRASDTAAVIVAELSANAVTHGRVPGRDFELTLSLIPGGRPGQLGRRGRARHNIRPLKGRCVEAVVQKG